jgi:hypothetical protein
MNKRVFTRTTLPTGMEALIYEGTGRHWFRAIRLSNGDTAQLIKYLLVELLEIDGKPVTEDYVDDMSICDILFASEVLNAMVTRGVPGLPNLFN